jgi:thioredoxin reductase
MADATQHHRVCVVGAGPSGLAALKVLSGSGIDDIVCHEAQDELGGIWVYSDDPDRPSVYASAHTISSKSLSQFSDFPMPASYPDYPSNRQILAYMRAYAENFGLARFIRFGSKVTKASRMADGRWLITYDDGAGGGSHTADYLVVCSGHHRTPLMPTLPGSFSGEILHSGRYKQAAAFTGKRVLVIGGGNSACDIAAAVSRVAEHVSISLRSPQVIAQKLALGRPIDVQYAKLKKFPRWLRQHILKLALKVVVGPYYKYGLPEPDFPVLSKHPTLNTDILEQIRHGDVTPRRGVVSVSGNRIAFADGSAGDFDTVICATGFRTEIPFMSDIAKGWGDAVSLPLYLKMMLADEPGLAFVGMVQPIGCIWVMAEDQARLVAAELAGTWKRPADIKAQVARQLARDSGRFVASHRHTLQIDTYEYRAEIEAFVGALRR